MIGVAALMALTGLVYYMGYNDVEKRHDGPGKLGISLAHCWEAEKVSV